MSNAPLLLVRTTIARHLRVPVSAVLPHHVLEADLAIDTIDLAFIAVDLEDVTDADIALPQLEDDATVEDLADVIAPVLEARRAPKLRAGGMR
ncbi:MAG: acyl carrier protein [Polyangiales bacterium]